MPYDPKKNPRSASKGRNARPSDRKPAAAGNRRNGPARPVEAEGKDRYRRYEYKPAEPSFRAEKTDAVPKDEYILTGRNPIREALKNGHDLEKMLVQKGELSGSAREIVQKAKEQKVQIQVVEKSRLDTIAPNHQGLIAFASAYQYSTVEEILQAAAEKGEKPFLIVLDGITDPHNLGAIIRTAECAGAHGIIVPQHRSVGLSPAAVKSSAGAVEYVKVARVNNLSRTIEQLQKEGVWFYAVTMNGTDYRKVTFDGGVALVIGAEEDGISRLVLEKCDQAVSLPMTGKIESLNASVAAGIMMYRVFDSRR
ncbi:MAG: 23S rRNA (guanosine(2251)-2'-O)-methyltransferase RlmB [Clostridiales bacterium]|nr:23S rRNA (guanosine(2251)-2'-O)-methyltransferase RlmB [Clostridiales bacterium]